MKNITVGITGPSGFLAGHTARLLASNEHIEVVLCPREYFGDATRLQAFVERCDSIIHLAGMNRGSNDDIYAINTQLVDQLLGATEGKNAATQIIFSSSTQRDSVYGKSKQYCERRLAEWAEAKPDRSATTFVIPNIFGPGCRPHYNSVVATFCHMLAGGKTPEVLQDNAIEFIWVTDVAQAIAKELNEPVYGHRQR
ncbi:MAG: NAD-dependent epimerase/dehydratase family protein, partial [Planctomycetota bacterium]